MKRTDFAFDLPAELIAQAPLAERSGSRLLSVDGSSGECSHLLFTDLVNLVSSDDLLVFNNTRVLPARLYANEGVAQVVFFEAAVSCEVSYTHRKG